MPRPEKWLKNPGRYDIDGIDAPFGSASYALHRYADETYHYCQVLQAFKNEGPLSGRWSVAIRIDDSWLNSDQIDRGQIYAWIPSYDPNNGGEDAGEFYLRWGQIESRAKGKNLEWTRKGFSAKKAAEEARKTNARIREECGGIQTSRKRSSSAPREYGYYADSYYEKATRGLAPWEAAEVTWEIMQSEGVPDDDAIAYLEDSDDADFNTDYRAWRSNPQEVNRRYMAKKRDEEFWLSNGQYNKKNKKQEKTGGKKMATTKKATSSTKKKTTAKKATSSIKKKRSP